jgi:ribosome recycling factor
MKNLMQKAVDVFHDQVISIMPGVVSAGLIESIKVIAWGSPTPIRQLASVHQGDKAISIRPFDPQIAGAIHKTLEAAEHNCYISKGVVTVNIPKWTTSADKDRATAQVRRLEEDTKVIIRNIRKKARQHLTGSEDEIRKAEKELQTMTDTYVSQVVTIANNKIKTL